MPQTRAELISRKENVVGNFEKFKNGLQSQITFLCENDYLTSYTVQQHAAAAWFKQDGGPQNEDVNAWTKGKLGGPKVVIENLTWHSVGRNGHRYFEQLCSTIDSLINSSLDNSWPKNKRDAWHWFKDQPLSSSTKVDMVAGVSGQAATGAAFRVAVAARSGTEADAPPTVIDWVEESLPQLSSPSSAS
jgi:hypothetical protein